MVLVVRESNLKLGFEYRKLLSIVLVYGYVFLEDMMNKWLLVMFLLSFSSLVLFHTKKKQTKIYNIKKVFNKSYWWNISFQSLNNNHSEHPVNIGIKYQMKANK